jgi:ATP-dependent DNA helicase PIF1
MATKRAYPELPLLPLPKRRRPAHLTREQLRAFDYMEDGGGSFFITGGPGTGKSMLMRALYQASPPYTSHVAASTGSAARNLECGAVTFNSFFNLGICKDDAQTIAKNMKSYRRNVIVNCVRLFVDEWSMISDATFELADDVARLVRNIDLPFGGIQLILSGDARQLSPVNKRQKKHVNSDGEECSPPVFEELDIAIPPPRPQLLAFKSPRWQAWFPRFVLLTQFFRQKNPHFVKILHQVGRASMSEETVEELQALARPIVMPDGLEPTILFAENKEAAALNKTKLEALPGRMRHYAARDTVLGTDGKPVQTIIDGMVVSGPEKLSTPNRWAYEAFDKHTLSKGIDLKVGASVMLLVNDYNMDFGLVNGSTGTVVEMLDDGVRVKFPEHQEPLLIAIRTWEEEDRRGNVQFVRLALPLICAWAITIHKSQGMSITYLIVDVGSAFAHGQVYVALSRARAMETLQILNFSAEVVTTDPDVEEFYSKLEQRQADIDAADEAENDDIAYCMSVAMD